MLPMGNALVYHKYLNPGYRRGILGGTSFCPAADVHFSQTFLQIGGWFDSIVENSILTTFLLSVLDKCLLQWLLSSGLSPYPRLLVCKTAWYVLI